MNTESGSFEPQSIAERVYTAPICLEPMPQQARTMFPDDDWSGMSSPAERRKRQNRLNQREYRKRKGTPVVSQLLAKPCRSKVGSNHKRGDNKTLGLVVDPENQPQPTGLWDTFHSAAGFRSFNLSALSRTAALCKSHTIEEDRILSELERWVSSKATGAPGIDRLLILVKFNFFRSLCLNSTSLGFQTEKDMEFDALSPFTLTHKTALPPVPATLLPTRLQCEIPHHPWIDMLPIPRMRDNLLKAEFENSYDDLELCADLVGFANSETARTGVIIWGDHPWDPAGWEVTEQYLQRWGWTIRGCWAVFDSTNRWRRKRGERPLRFDRLMCEEVDGWKRECRS